MKILVCDKCGARKEVDAIVGTEFKNFGYETLMPMFRANGVTDVCGPCYKAIIKVHSEARQETSDSVLDRVKAFVGMR